MKLTKTILFVGAIAFTMAIVSCGGSKPAAKKDDGLGKKVTLPCNDMDYHSDQKFFRSTGNATSPNQSMAKSKASLDASANLAAAINRTIKQVADRYRNERTVGETQEFEEKFEQMTRDVVNQEMNNVVTKCSESYVKDGKWTFYIAVEVAKDELLSNIKEKISKDQKLQLDYDKMKFEDKFNEEMNKLAGEKP
jgi:hypothetical protein